MASATTTVRISETVHSTLRDLADQSGQSMQAVIEQAIEQYRRQRLLEAANAGFAALRGDKKAWADETAERTAWEGTLADNLDENPL